MAGIVTFMKIGALQKQSNSRCYSINHCFSKSSLQQWPMPMPMSVSKCGGQFSKHNCENSAKLCRKDSLFETPTMWFLFSLLSKKGVKEMEIFACRLPWKTLGLPWRYQGEILPH